MAAISGIGNEITYRVDLNRGIKKTYLDMLFATEDNQAHVFRIIPYYGAEAARLPDDMTIKGYFINYKNNTTSILSGGYIEDNAVCLMLTQSCYSVPGQFALIIKARSGNRTNTVFYGEGTIFVSRTDTVIDDANIIPSLDDLLAQISAMEAAEEAAKTATANANSAATNASNAAAKIDGMTVSAVNGSSANAVITEQNGVKHITFTLPKGDKGDPGTGGSGEAAPWLVGSTDEITPTQVKAALNSEQNVLLSYNSDFTGLIKFQNFMILDTLGAVVSSTIGHFNNVMSTILILGSTDADTWNVSIKEVAERKDIPTIPAALPNPYTLTFSGAVTGTYDGSAAKTINIPTIAGADGKDGQDGADGKTPVKGVDYWTDADQESMVQQVIAAIGTPVFGYVDEDNNIILTGNLTNETYTLKYEDGNGNLILIGTLDGASIVTYINRLKQSIGSDGAPYNGGKGWKADTRLNSSGAEVDATGTEVTGFMPFTLGDVWRFKNIKIAGTDESNTTQYVVWYDANFTKLLHVYTHSLYGHSGNQPNFTLTSDGYWEKFNTSALNTFNTELDWSSVKYFRISAEEITDESIITINQAID